MAFRNLRSVHWDGNPIAEPTEEPWCLGLVAIRSFVRAQLPGGESVRADTINMLEDIDAGKNSMARSLIAGAPDPAIEADRTLLVKLRMKSEEVTGRSVNINDFGGHNVYHSIFARKVTSHAST